MAIGRPCTPTRRQTTKTRKRKKGPKAQVTKRGRAMAWRAGTGHGRQPAGGGEDRKEETEEETMEGSKRKRKRRRRRGWGLHNRVCHRGMVLVCGCSLVCVSGQEGLRHAAGHAAGRAAVRRLGMSQYEEVLAAECLVAPGRHVEETRGDERGQHPEHARSTSILVPCPALVRACVSLRLLVVRACGRGRRAAAACHRQGQPGYERPIFVSFVVCFVCFVLLLVLCLSFCLVFCCPRTSSLCNAYT